MNNPLQFVQMMRNPQMMMQTLQNNPRLQGNQPLMSAVNAMQKGNMEEVEKIARNVCKQNGMDADQLLGQVKQQYGGMQ